MSNSTNKEKAALFKFVRQHLPRGWSLAERLNRIAQPLDVSFTCPLPQLSFLLEHVSSSCCQEQPVQALAGKGRGLPSLAAIPPGTADAWKCHVGHLRLQAEVAQLLWLHSENRAATSHTADQLILVNTQPQ